MDEKRNAILTVGILCVIILVFTVADFLNEDHIYSEAENRLLAMRPVFSGEGLLTGEYTADYEDYITDQFIGRDKSLPYSCGVFCRAG